MSLWSKTDMWWEKGFLCVLAAAVICASVTLRSRKNKKERKKERQKERKREEDRGDWSGWRIVSTPLCCGVVCCAAER